MLTIVKRTAGLWWQSWPWLVAIYLVGWFVRYWTLQGAIAEPGHVVEHKAWRWVNLHISALPLKTHRSPRWQIQP